MGNVPTHRNTIKEEREPNMRMSRLFSQTLREVTADVEVASHQLLLRAFIRPLASGIFSPWRAVDAQDRGHYPPTR